MLLVQIFQHAISDMLNHVLFINYRETTVHWLKLMSLIQILTTFISNFNRIVGYRRELQLAESITGDSICFELNPKVVVG